MSRSVLLHEVAGFAPYSGVRSRLPQMRSKEGKPPQRTPQGQERHSGSSRTEGKTEPGHRARQGGAGPGSLEHFTYRTTSSAKTDSFCLPFQSGCLVLFPAGLSGWNQSSVAQRGKRRHPCFVPISGGSIWLRCSPLGT